MDHTKAIATASAALLLLTVAASGATANATGASGAAGVIDAISVPADSPRWDLQGGASVVDYQGKRALQLDGGAAVLRDFTLRDGVIDVDVATTARRGFFGVQFRLDEAGANGEWVYLRPHKSGLPDALQYTPILNTGLNWQLYSGPGFTGPTEIPSGSWFHLRLTIAGAQAALYLDDMTVPILQIDDLKSGVEEGQLALAVLTGATYFTNLTVRPASPAPWVRRPPPTPPGTLTQWSLSPSLDALERNLERPLTPEEVRAMAWQDVEAEPPGIVAVNRHRDSPHPRVSFARDFTKRLEPQPGMRVVYARTVLEVDRDQVKKLCLGYSDDVSVFLDGRILFRGRSAQSFRDPGFLGIMSAENDAIYLPLKKGRNELILAVSELGGGWGFSARLEDLAK